jgi:hypothetical protein
LLALHTGACRRSLGAGWCNEFDVTPPAKPGRFISSGGLCGKIQKEVAMSVTSNSDFAKQMLLLARPAEQFRPTATYDPDGDCIEFLAKPDPFYGERVDDLVTVYYSQESGELIGCLLKGISQFCKQMLERMPGIRIEIHDGKMRLVHVFRAHVWSSPSDPQDTQTLVYRKRIDVAEEA